MSIVMAGAVYCPLSPQDPEQRLQALVGQTKSGLVLVHWLTEAKFCPDIVTVDIDVTISMEATMDELVHRFLSDVTITLDNVAYVIFTSGSTGTPKAVGFLEKQAMSTLSNFPSI